jgi:hypothetical protein
MIGNDHFLLQGFLPNAVMQGKHSFGQRSTGYYSMASHL